MKQSDVEDGRWLRDLEWAVTSPFLIGDSPALELDLGQITAPEERFSGHRVGYYFESLIEFWLEKVRRVEMIAKGHQIIADGKTLGELDFVFRDETGQVNHWEVAAKFYLYCEDQQLDGSHFIGPNAGDTFERKRDKIFGQQLPLSVKTFPEVMRREAFVKGRIFYHPQEAAPVILPEGLAEDHLRGVWLRRSELDWLGQLGSGTRFKIAKKPHWLAAGISENGMALGEFRAHLENRLREVEHPILVNVDGDGEADQMFVVPDEWPALSSALCSIGIPGSVN